jgi:hypothetical protein
MVFTDNNNMANTSNQLSLTPSSTARELRCKSVKQMALWSALAPTPPTQAQLINFLS